MIKNPVINIKGEPLTSCTNISNNGIYNVYSNTIDWNNPTRNNETVSYRFSEVLKVKNESTFIFNGIVHKNITDAPPVYIPDENLKKVLLNALGKSSNDIITKNDLKLITGLDASDENITSLTGLEYCENLEKLDLYNNNISDFSPLSNLKELRKLDLSNNNLTDISMISKLTNLNVLNLYNNNISDISPLRTLKNLTTLDFAFNDVFDISSLSLLTNLSILDFSSNVVSDVYPLCTLKNLTFLDFSNIEHQTSKGNSLINKIFYNTDSPSNHYLLSTNTRSNYNNIDDITALKNLSKSTEIYGSNNKVVDLTPLSNLTKLTTLDLMNNKISNVSPLKNLKNLTTLILNGQKISLEDLISSGSVTIDNPIKDYDNSNVTQISSISNDGSYDKDKNCITWSGLKNDTKLSFKFSCEDSIGYDHSTDFSGTISANVIYNTSVNIPDEYLKAAIIKTLGKNEGYSITKEDMQSITNLRATNQNISSIEGLQYCTNLNSLTLKNNNISDISCLKNLTKLTYLDLGNNVITDIEPASHIKTLNNLFAYQNKISDISSLSNLVNLTSLSLYGEQDNKSDKYKYKISDINCIKDLKKLTSLSLAYQNITDISALANLTRLTSLFLNTNKISDISSLSQLTLLENLALGDNSISDINCLKTLSTNLKSLLLNNNNITDISIISNFNNLTELALSNNKISDLSSLSNLTELNSLYLLGCEISDISPLAKLEKLDKLDLSDQVITLPEEKFTDTVSFKNPIKFLDGTSIPITETSISNKGSYDLDTNTLTWPQLNNNTTVTFSFTKDFSVKIGKAYTIFSGQVSKKIINC